MTHYQRAMSALLVLVLPLAALVFAANNEYPTSKSAPNHYDLDAQTAAWRTDRSTADSTSIATLTSTTTGRFGLFGRRTLVVGGRAAVSGATVSVAVLYGVCTSSGTFVPKGITSPQTLTAGTITDAAGRYVAPDRYFDGGGAQYAYLVITTASSSGVWDLWVGSY